MQKQNCEPMPMVLSKLANWQPIECVLQVHWPSVTLRDWLSDCGSLTARLKARSDNFQLYVKQQRFTYPDSTEQRILGLQPRRYALLREVYLLCDGEPWVFGHSFFPLASLVGEQRCLSATGQQPLGERLFRHPQLRRDNFEIARLIPGHALFQSAMQDINENTNNLWARRSVFRIKDKAVLVTEVFLPAMLRCEQ